MVKKNAPIWDPKKIGRPYRHEKPSSRISCDSFDNPVKVYVSYKPKQHD